MKKHFNYFRAIFGLYIYIYTVNYDINSNIFVLQI